MTSFQTYSEIIGVGHYLPERIATNDDLAKMMDTSDAWIRERTGIQQRHLASVSESTSDLAVNASRKALENLSPETIDCIVAATLSPDYYFPGIGVQIQHKLGLTTIPAIDIRGQCSGFSWALATADSFIRSGLYKNILVVGAEIHSRVLEFTDRGRNVTVLFGDAAGACVLRAGNASSLPTAKNNIRGIIDHHLGSDGSGAEYLAMLRPGLAANRERFFFAHEVDEGAYLPHMDGKQVFRNATQRMVETAQYLIKKHDLTLDQIDLVVPHQANMRINEYVREKLGLPPDKVYNNIHRYGNTTAATLPLSLSEASSIGVLKPGMLVLTLAFGAGFTWGGNLFRW